MKIPTASVTTHWTCCNGACSKLNDEIRLSLDNWNGEFGSPVCDECDDDLLQRCDCTIDLGEHHRELVSLQIRVRKLLSALTKAIKATEKPLRKEKP